MPVGNRKLLDHCALARSLYAEARQAGKTKREASNIARTGANKTWYQYSRRIFMWMKKHEGCNRCGYNTSAAALHFHHIDPATKNHQVTLSNAGSWPRLLDESLKCEVLCANCHAAETHPEL